MVLGGFWTDVHPATVLLVIGAVILTLLVGVALSPAGRPVSRRGRAGGLTRALADRADGEGGSR